MRASRNMVGCAAAIVLSLVAIGAFVWWVLREISPDELTVQNETDETLTVWSAVDDYCDLVVVPPRSQSNYGSDNSFPCRHPTVIEFRFEEFGVAAQCRWEDAKHAEPVRVTYEGTDCGPFTIGPGAIVSPPQVALTPGPFVVQTATPQTACFGISPPCPTSTQRAVVSSPTAGPQ